MARHRINKSYNKVGVTLHNTWHEMFLAGTITIKALVDIGISQRNAYVIKKWPARIERPTTGPKPKIAACYKGLIVRKAKRNRWWTFKKIINFMLRRYHIKLSKFLLRHILKQAGLFSRIARPTLTLKEKHNHQRFEYAKVWVDDVDEQKLIVFSDESMFCENPSCRQRVIRFNGEAYELKNLLPKIKQGGVQIMLFGCISYKRKGFIVPVEGIINGAKYLQIVNEHVIPFMNSHSSVDEIYFMQDNASPHKTAPVMDRLQSQAFEVIDHPPFSPDCNPIELLWARLEQDITRVDRSSKEGLLEALLDAFDKITLEEIQALYRHHAENIREVVRRKGAQTGK